MVSDGGSVQDKAFNENTLKGVADFGNTNDKTYNFVQSTPGSLLPSYSKALAGGAEVLVGSGYMHDDGFKDGHLVAGEASQ